MKDILNPRGRYKYIIDEIIDDIIQGLSTAEISQKYDIPKRTINHWQDKLRKAGINVKKNKLALENHTIHGTTTLYDAEGNVKHQYIKTSLDKQAMLEAMQAAVDAMKEDIKPLRPCGEHKGSVEKDILACHVLSDFHLGMFAHKEESGEDWDLDIAEETMNKWIDKAISISPRAETGLFLQLGDLLHTDGVLPVTPTSKHVLDVGCRFQKIVQASIRGIRRVITRMLEKYKHVHVILASANHDMTSSIWLREMFAVLYEKEPRVTIDTTEHPYYCFEWGKTSIFAHHGHKRNIKNVSQTFAGLYREVFGRTKYSYGHIGHFHHVEVKEDNLMQIEIHSTLAPKDAYAAHGGYLANRKAKTILYHKEHGEVGTFNVTPSML